MKMKYGWMKRNNVKSVKDSCRNLLIINVLIAAKMSKFGTRIRSNARIVLIG